MHGIQFHLEIVKHTNRASVFKEDIRGHISLLVVHDSLILSAVTNVEFCRGNGVINLWNNILCSHAGHISKARGSCFFLSCCWWSPSEKTLRLSLETPVNRSVRMPWQTLTHASWKFHCSRCWTQVSIGRSFSLSIDALSGWLVSNKLCVKVNEANWMSYFLYRCAISFIRTLTRHLKQNKPTHKVHQLRLKPYYFSTDQTGDQVTH